MASAAKSVSLLLDSLHVCIGGGAEAEYVDAEGIVISLVDVLTQQVSDDEVGAATSALFDTRRGLLPVLDAFIPKSDKRSVLAKRAILHLIYNYLEFTGMRIGTTFAVAIKTASFSTFRRDASGQVREAALAAVQRIVELGVANERELGVCDMSDKLLHELISKGKNKNSGGVLSAQLRLAGVLCEAFPAELAQHRLAIFSLYQHQLHVQSLQSKPDNLVIVGCLQGLAPFLSEFSDSLDDDGAVDSCSWTTMAEEAFGCLPLGTTARDFVFFHLLIHCQPLKKGARTASSEAALHILSKHASLFRAQMKRHFLGTTGTGTDGDTGDSVRHGLFDCLYIAYRHVNTKLRAAAFPALNAVVAQTCSQLVADRKEKLAAANGDAAGDSGAGTGVAAPSLLTSMSVDGESEEEVLFRYCYHTFFNLLHPPNTDNVQAAEGDDAQNVYDDDDEDSNNCTGGGAGPYGGGGDGGGQSSSAAAADTYRPLSLAVCCFGYFAGPLAVFKGAGEVRNVMDHLFEKCSTIISRFRQHSEDARAFVASFVQAFALLVFELPAVDDAILSNLERLVGTLFASFPLLVEKEKTRGYRALARLFVTLNAKGALSDLLSRIVRHGVAMTIAVPLGAFAAAGMVPRMENALTAVVTDVDHATVAPSAAAGTLGTTTAAAAVAASVAAPIPMVGVPGGAGADRPDYMPLWLALLDRQYFPTEHDWPEGTVLSETEANIVTTVYDEVVTVVLSLLNTLDVSYSTQQPQHNHNQQNASSGAGCVGDGGDGGGGDGGISLLVDDLVPNNMVDMFEFLNLVDFCRDLLPSASTKRFLSWAFVYGKTVITLSTRYPCVSGFYKLVTVLVDVANTHSYFGTTALSADTDMKRNLRGGDDEVHDGDIAVVDDDEVGGGAKQDEEESDSTFGQERTACLSMLSGFFEEIAWQHLQFKDELQAACLEMLLAVPQVFLKSHGRLPQFVVPLQTALKQGLSYPTLANTAIDALQRWLAWPEVEALLLEQLPSVLPMFDPYLCCPTEGALSELEAGDLDTRGGGGSDGVDRARDHIAASSVLDRHSKRAKSFKDKFTLGGGANGTSVDGKIQMRILRLVGSLAGRNHCLVKSNGLLEAVGHETGISWDTEYHVACRIPFADMKATFYMDPLLPRIVELAETATDRQTKIVASELLHSTVLIMLATNAAKSGQRSQKATPLHKLYKHLFPALLRIATDVDQVTTQLFKTLVMQIIHWLTSNDQAESKDTMSLLDAIMDMLGHTENATYRDFGATCLAEFLHWSMKHQRVRRSTGDMANIKSVLKRLYSLTNHSNTWKRMGSYLGFIRVYYAVRDEESVIDIFAFDIIHNALNGLVKAHDDDPAVGSCALAQQAVRKLGGLILQYSRPGAGGNGSILRNVGVQTMPREKRRAFSSLGDFVRHLFNQIGSRHITYRQECVRLFMELAPLTEDNNNVDKWIKKLAKDRDVSSSKLFLTTLDSNLHAALLEEHPSSAWTLPQLKVCFDSMEASANGYAMVLTKSEMGMNTKTLFGSSQSKLFGAVNNFIQRFATTSTSSFTSLLELASPKQVQSFNLHRFSAVVSVLELLWMFAQDLSKSGGDFKAPFFKIDHKQNFSHLCNLIFTCVFKSEECGADFHSSLAPIKKMDTALRFLVGSLPKSTHFEGKELMKEHLFTFLSKPENQITNEALLKRPVQTQRLAKGFILLLKPGRGVSAVQTVLLGRFLEDYANRDFAKSLLSIAAALPASCPPSLIQPTCDILDLALTIGQQHCALPLWTVLNERAVDAGTSVSAASLFYNRFESFVNRFLMEPGVQCEYLQKVVEMVNVSPLMLKIFHGMISCAGAAGVTTDFAEGQSRLGRFMECMPILSVWQDIKGQSLDAQKNLLNVISRFIVIAPTYVLSDIQPAFNMIMDTFCLFIGRDSSVTLKKHSLELLPLLFAQPNAATDRLLKKLSGMVLDSFPIVQFDSVSTTVHSSRSKHWDTNQSILFDRLITTLKSGCCVEFFETLFPLLPSITEKMDQEMDLSMRTFFAQADEARAQGVFDLCRAQVANVDSAPSVRLHAVFKVAVNMLLMVPQHVSVSVFQRNISYLVDTVCTAGPDCIDARVDPIKVICACKMLQCMYDRFSADFIKTTIAKAFAPQGEGTELNKVVLKNAHYIAVKPIDGVQGGAAGAGTAEQTQHLKMQIAQKLRCSAYNTLASAIMTTQVDNAKFPQYLTMFLFKEDDAKGQVIWSNLVDVSATHYFEVETAFATKDKAQAILKHLNGANSVADRADMVLRSYLGGTLADSSLSLRESGGPSYAGPAASQSLLTSGPSQFFNDAGRVPGRPAAALSANNADARRRHAGGSLDLNSGDGTSSSTALPFPGANSSSGGPAMPGAVRLQHDFEMDPFNSTDSMPTILRVIHVLRDHEKNKTDAKASKKGGGAKVPDVPSTGPAAKMPGWMEHLLAPLKKQTGTPPNVRLFLCKIAINEPEMFEPYAEHWVGPLLQLVVDGLCSHSADSGSGSGGGEGVSYYARDVFITICIWEDMRRGRHAALVQHQAQQAAAAVAGGGSNKEARTAAAAAAEEASVTAGTAGIGLPILNMDTGGNGLVDSREAGRILASNAMEWLMRRVPDRQGRIVKLNMEIVKQLLVCWKAQPQATSIGGAAGLKVNKKFALGFMRAKDSGGGSQGDWITKRIAGINLLAAICVAGYPAWDPVADPPIFDGKVSQDTFYRYVIECVGESSKRIHQPAATLVGIMLRQASLAGDSVGVGMMRERLVDSKIRPALNTQKYGYAFTVLHAVACGAGPYHSFPQIVDNSGGGGSLQTAVCSLLVGNSLAGEFKMYALEIILASLDFIGAPAPLKPTSLHLLGDPPHAVASAAFSASAFMLLGPALAPLLATRDRDHQLLTVTILSRLVREATSADLSRFLPIMLRHLPSSSDSACRSMMYDVLVKVFDRETTIIQAASKAAAKKHAAAVTATATAGIQQQQTSGGGQLPFDLMDLGDAGDDDDDDDGRTPGAEGGAGKPAVDDTISAALLDQIRTQLLLGLADSSVGVRDKLFAFWDHGLRTPRDTVGRLQATLSGLFAPGVEHHWLSYSTRLLLQLSRDSLDYKSREVLFLHPLDKCSFVEMPIASSWSSRSLPMTPMFSQQSMSLQAAAASAGAVMGTLEGSLGTLNFGFGYGGDTGSTGGGGGTQGGGGGGGDQLRGVPATQAGGGAAAANYGFLWTQDTAGGSGGALASLSHGGGGHGVSQSQYGQGGGAYVFGTQGGGGGGGDGRGAQGGVPIGPGGSGGSGGRSSSLVVSLMGPPPPVPKFHLPSGGGGTGGGGGGGGGGSTAMAADAHGAGHASGGGSFSIGFSSQAMLHASVPSQEVVLRRSRFRKTEEGNEGHDRGLWARRSTVSKRRRSDFASRVEAARSGKVTMFRSYRAGELPDVQIRHCDVIDPLQALAQRDYTIARLLYSQLASSVVGAAEEAGLVPGGAQSTCGGAGATLASSSMVANAAAAAAAAVSSGRGVLSAASAAAMSAAASPPLLRPDYIVRDGLEGALQGVLSRCSRCSPLAGCLHNLAGSLQLGIEPSIILSSSTANSSLHSGVKYLEDVILRGGKESQLDQQFVGLDDGSGVAQEGGEGGGAKKRGAVDISSDGSAEPLKSAESEDQWKALARLYELLGEDDVVHGLHKARFCSPYTSAGLAAEHRLEFRQAYDTYDRGCQAVDYDETDSGAVVWTGDGPRPTQQEQDLWFDRRLECFRRLLEWPNLKANVDLELDVSEDADGGAARYGPALWAEKGGAFLPYVMQYSIKTPDIRSSVPFLSFLKEAVLKEATVIGQNADNNSTPGYGAVTAQDQLSASLVQRSFEVEHGASICLAWVAADDLERAQTQVSRAFKAFLDTWAQTHRLSTRARLKQLSRLQGLVEIEEALLLISSAPFRRGEADAVDTLAATWARRNPSVTDADGVAWDDHYVTRDLLSDRIRDRFVKRGRYDPKVDASLVGVRIDALTNASAATLEQGDLDACARFQAVWGDKLNESERYLQSGVGFGGQGLQGTLTERRLQHTTATLAQRRDRACGSIADSHFRAINEAVLVQAAAAVVDTSTGSRQRLSENDRMSRACKTVLLQVRLEQLASLLKEAHDVSARASATTAGGVKNRYRHHERAELQHELLCARLSADCECAFQDALAIDPLADIREPLKTLGGSREAWQASAHDRYRHVISKCSYRQGGGGGDGGGDTDLDMVVSARLAYAMFSDERCYQNTMTETPEGQATADVHAVAVFDNLLQAMRCGSKAAHARFGRAITLLVETGARGFNGGGSGGKKAKGSSQGTGAAFRDAIACNPSWQFISWAPQMLALLNTPVGPGAVYPTVKRMAAEYPQAIMFPFRVVQDDLLAHASSGGAVEESSACTMKDELQRLLANDIVTELQKHLMQVHSPELRMHDWLKALIGLYKTEGEYRALAMNPMWKRNVTACFRKGVSELMPDKATQFYKQHLGDYNRKFADDWRKEVIAKGPMGKLIESEGEMGDCDSAVNPPSWKEFRTWVSKINTKVSQLAPKCGPAKLRDRSVWLSEEYGGESFCLDYQGPTAAPLEVPGQYSADCGRLFRAPDPSQHVTIAGFDPDVRIMASIRKPVKMVVRGSDERSYSVLVKGGEDLRNDQRIQQLFAVMNSLLQGDPASSKRRLHVRTYEVTPMSQELGIIEWVDDTTTLKSIVDEELQSREGGKGVDHLEAKKAYTHRDWAGGCDHRKTGYSPLYAKTSRECRKIWRKMALTQGSSDDCLSRGILKLSSCVESYLTIRSSFARSYATLCMCQYVAGIGDRHLDNFLLSKADGDLIGIDFGHAFGTATFMLPIPELMPFRLTGQISQFMRPLDSEGYLKASMVSSLGGLQKGKDVILSTLDLYVKEPLLDWQDWAAKAMNKPDGAAAAGPADAGGGGAHMIESFALEAIQGTRRKLTGMHPAAVFEKHLDIWTQRKNKEYAKAIPNIKLVLQGKDIGSAPSGTVLSLRAQVPVQTRSVQEQVDCLVELATDYRVLGRTWIGWASWL